jgi:DNA mismatch endonuclease (patch repair protein)
MVDVLTPKQRQLNMSRIRGKDTTPELLLRCGLHKRGIRFQLHRKDLPGRPDITLPKFNIFVNGCFWHGHDCPMFKLPVTRHDFWENKIQKTRERDTHAISSLRADGWRPFVLWECAIRGRDRLPVATVIDQLIAWLKGDESIGVLRGHWTNSGHPSFASDLLPRPQCGT